MKYYFRDDCEERCYSLSTHLEYMQDEGIAEMDVYEAEMERGTNYFYCTEYGEVGETGEGCGNGCDLYAPRNGKNGRCKYSSNCYIPTDKVKHLKIKP